MPDDRERRVRRRRPALQDRGHAARTQRLDPDTAFARDRRRPRVGDREPQPRARPFGLRRHVQRDARRLRRAGVRPAHRTSSANVGRARPHPARRLAFDSPDERLPLGRLPRELDPPRRQDRFLVSMRDTWAAYIVDADTGHIEWTLGGKHSSFDFGPDAEFQWQHDVTLRSNSEVTLFDDHCCQARGADTWVNATAPSRGLVLKLDQRAVRRSSSPSTGRTAGSRPRTWATRSLSPTATCWSAGARNRTSRSTTRRAGRCWTRPSRLPTSPTA